MAYKDRFGITDICKEIYNNLSISWDCKNNPEDEKQRYPVLLFTPDMDNTDKHYHIELNRRQAKALRDWLTDYLENKPTKHKK